MNSPNFSRHHCLAGEKRVIFVEVATSHENHRKLDANQYPNGE
jgi:hypothetical protein